MNNQNISEAEARELGSAEFNAMTFTLPGGSAMTLDEYASHRQAEEAQRAEGVKVLQQENADEERRRDMRDMTTEQRAVYLAQENVQNQ